MRFQLYLPVKPNQWNQAFGNDPAYYAKFHDSFGNPLKGHDGIDFFARHGTPVYAAHDGMIHFERDSHGGEGMAIHDTKGNYDNIVGFPVTMYWHLIGDTEPTKYPSPIKTDGQSYPVKAGDLIGYADNTGAPYESSGDHLHFGLFSVDAKENTYNLRNGFNGRLNPALYLSTIFAQDIPMLTILYTKVVELLQKIKNNLH